MPFKGYAETGNIKRPLFQVSARTSLGRIATVAPCPIKGKGFRAILFHPDYTVGSGISPDLLTFHHSVMEALAGSGISPDTAGGEFHPALRTSQR